jgi:hypothetical protein
MSLDAKAKFGANRTVVGSATASEQENLRGTIFSYPQLESPRPLTVVVGRSVSADGGNDAARSIPIYARIIAGIGRATFIREIDIGPLNVLPLVADRLTVEYNVDPRFDTTAFRTEVYAGAGEGSINGPPATKTTLSLTAETIASPGEWLSDIPPGADSASILTQAAAQLMVGLGSAKNGVAVAGTSGARPPPRATRRARSRASSCQASAPRRSSRG